MKDDLFELFKIFVENGYNNKEIVFSDDIYLSNSFYNNLYDLIEVISKYTSYKFLKKVKIKGKKFNDTTTISDYGFKDKTLLIYMSNILEYIKEEVLNKPNVDLIDYYKYLYYIIFSAILHEREHVMQYQLMISPFNQSIEKDILKFVDLFHKNRLTKLSKEKLKQSKMKVSRVNIFNSKKEICKIYNTLYNKHYFLDPMERLAEIRSYTIMKQIFQNKDEYEYYYFLSQFKIISSIITSYDLINETVISPSISFMNKISDAITHENIPFKWYSENQIQCLENILSTLSLKERLLYGLPITYDEYNKQNEIYTFYEKKIGSYIY